jgi:hypothetical protein
MGWLAGGPAKAATNKCLARSNKSHTGAKATIKKRNPQQASKAMPVTLHFRSNRRQRETMKLITIFTACTLACTAQAGSAAAKDMLIVMLEQTNNGTDGIHKVMVEKCEQFLKDYQRITKVGKIVSLTIKGEPEVTGSVVHAFCIYPDGTTEGDTWLFNKGS